MHPHQNQHISRILHKDGIEYVSNGYSPSGFQNQEEIMAQIDLYSNVQSSHFYQTKNRPSELPRLSSIKNNQIAINLKEQPLAKSNFMNEAKKPNYFSSPSDSINQQNSQNEPLDVNLFKNQNPGLFYGHSIQFDSQPQSHKSIHNQVSIESFSQKQKPSNTEIYLSSTTPKDHEKYSSKSGTTIIDLETEKEFSFTKFQFQKESALKSLDEKSEKSLNEEKPSERQIYRVKTVQVDEGCINRASFSKFRQNAELRIKVQPKHQSNHRQNCRASIPSSSKEEKQKEFVVPIVRNSAKHNKSKYKEKEYLNINDENLTKFFTTKDKKNYLDNVVCSASTFFSSNVFKSGVEQSGQNGYKASKFAPGESHVSNNFPSTERNTFYMQRSAADYVNVTIENTKFMIRSSPSEKHRKFFNQSCSTLMNHNYRPLTCRKNPIKRKVFQESQQKSNKNVVQNKMSGSNSQFKPKSQIPENSQNVKMSCDYWAQINSFKRMNENSKRNKKISDPESQLSKNRQNPDAIKETEPDEVIQLYNKENHEITFSENQSNVLPKSQVSSKFKNSTVFEVEMIRNNNIKRVRNFEKSVMSKLNIVAKMGVKLPLH